MLKTKTKIILFSILGLAAAPFAASAGTSPASVSNTTTVTANITATISISPSTTPITLSLAPTSSAVESATSGTYTVITNDTSGYTLSIVDADTNNALVSSSPSASFAAGGGTLFSAPALLTPNTWGFHLDTMGGSPGTGATESSVATPTTIKYDQVPTSTTGPMTILTGAENAPSGTATVVWYGAQANSTQVSSTSGYVDVITLTATGS